MKTHLAHRMCNSEALQVVLGSSPQTMSERELVDKCPNFLACFGGYIWGGLYILPEFPSRVEF